MSINVLSLLRKERVYDNLWAGKTAMISLIEHESHEFERRFARIAIAKIPYIYNKV